MSKEKKETDKEGFRKAPEPFICPKCGHNEAQLDPMLRLRGVRRVTPGNVICAKCHEPIAAKLT